jgi:CBS domain-containing protein
MVLTIGELLDAGFLTAPSTTTALEGARRMVAGRHGYLLVVDDGTPSGIVTEWDYVEKVVARGVDPTSVTVRAIASAPVISCEQTAPTQEVVDLMVQKGIRRMVITDHGKVVGVIGAKELLRSFRGYVDRISADIARLQSSFP